jgi:hypothetical protein
MTPTVFHIPSTPGTRFCELHSEFYDTECSRCASEEVRGNLGLVAGLALGAAIVLLAVIVCLVAHYTVGAR